MRTQLSVAFGSLLIWGVASAQSTLPAVQVRADTRESVDVSCTNPDSVKSQDIERVLAVESPATRSLRRHFVSAVTAACKAGVPHILMTRKANDQVTWKKMD